MGVAHEFAVRMKVQVAIFVQAFLTRKFIGLKRYSMIGILCRYCANLACIVHMLTGYRYLENLLFNTCQKKNTQQHRSKRFCPVGTDKDVDLKGSSEPAREASTSGMGFSDLLKDAISDVRQAEDPAQPAMNYKPSQSPLNDPSPDDTQSHLSNIAFSQLASGSQEPQGPKSTHDGSLVANDGDIAMKPVSPPGSSQQKMAETSPSPAG